MLAWTIYGSFLGALMLLIWPRPRACTVRWIALLTATAGFAIALTAVLGASGASGVVTIVKTSWITSLGSEYFLAADGISLTLVLLTGIAAVTGVLFSWNIEHRVREFFAI